MIGSVYTVVADSKALTSTEGATCFHWRQPTPPGQEICGPITVGSGIIVGGNQLGSFWCGSDSILCIQTWSCTIDVRKVVLK